MLPSRRSRPFDPATDVGVLPAEDVAPISDASAPRTSQRTMARAVSWAWGGSLVSQLAWFGSLIVLGALLPPKSFGTVAIGVALAAAAAVIQDAGGRGSIVLAKTLYRSDLTRIFAINVACGALITVALAALAVPIIDHLAPGGDATVFRIFALSIGVRAVAIVPLAVLQRTMQFKLRSSVMAVSTTIAAVSSVVAGALGAGVWALVVRQLAAAALLPILAWLVAVGPVRREVVAGPTPRRHRRPRGAFWFFVLAATDFLVLNLDTVIVGHFRGAAELGLYSLAFTLAFAPLTNFAVQIGTVVFPAAAAARDLDTVVQRMLWTVRLTALVLLPFLTPTVLLAPVVLPALFGGEWTTMVVPFQILVVTGVGYALLSLIGNSLSGAGEIAWRARVELVWCLGMAVAMVGLVRAFGIRGAAVAHLLLFVPFLSVYLFVALRRLGSTAGAFVSSLRGVMVPVVCQALLSAACLVALEMLGVPDAAAAVAAAAGGIVFVALAIGLYDRDLLRESHAFVSAVRARGASPS